MSILADIIVRRKYLTLDNSEVNIRQENRTLPQLKRRNVDISQLQNVLNHSWCAETAYGEWRNNVPSLNQCAVTALIVQDYCSGKILRRKMTNGANHFLNLLPDGTEVDLTAVQFDWITSQPIKQETLIVNRSQLTRHKSVVKRYELLKQRIQNNLTQTIIPAN